MDNFKQYFYEKLVNLRLQEDIPLIKDVVKWLKVYPIPIEGCTQEEIEELKQLQEVAILPKIYEAFLQVAGRSCGDIFIGYDSTYYSIKKLKVFLLKTIQEDESTRVLPAESFVFLSKHHYAFWYFSALEDSYDPPVYRYVEKGGEEEEDMLLYGRDESPEPIFAHLSEFLTEFIAEREGKEAQMEFLREHVVRK